MSVYEYEDGPSPTTVTPPPAAGEYIGCYADPKEGRIMIQEATQDDMTIEVNTQHYSMYGSNVRNGVFPCGTRWIYYRHAVV